MYIVHYIFVLRTVVTIVCGLNTLFSLNTCIRINLSQVVQGCTVSSVYVPVFQYLY